MSKIDFSAQPHISPLVHSILESVTMINGNARPESSIHRSGRIIIDDLKEKYEADIKSLKEMCDERSKIIDMLHDDRISLVNRIDELEKASPTCEIDHALGHAMAVHKKFPDFDIEVFKNGKLLVGIRTNSMNCMVINL